MTIMRHRQLGDSLGEDSLGDGQGNSTIVAMRRAFTYASGVHTFSLRVKMLAALLLDALTVVLLRPRTCGPCVEIDGAGPRTAATGLIAIDAGRTAIFARRTHSEGVSV
jgi:hypothetical protein